MRILVASVILLMASSMVLVAAEHIATLSPPGEDQPEYLPGPANKTPDPRIIRARVIPPVQNPVDIGHLLPEGHEVPLGANVIETMADKFPEPEEETVDESVDEDNSDPANPPNADGIISEQIVDQQLGHVETKTKEFRVQKPDGSVAKVLVKEPKIEPPGRPAPRRWADEERFMLQSLNGTTDGPKATTAGKGSEPLSALTIVLIVLGVLMLIIAMVAVVIALLRDRKKKQAAAAAAAAGPVVAGGPEVVVNPDSSSGQSDSSAQQ